MKIHHIGYAVHNIDKSLKEFKKMGYEEEGELIKDEKRNVLIKFIKNNSYRLELIAPYNKTSPIDSVLKKIGPTLYHICYEVDDIDFEIERLREEKWVVIQKPLYAPALGSKCAFLYNKEIGVVEFVKSKH